jgi:hypothetical protein
LTPIEVEIKPGLKFPSTCYIIYLPLILPVIPSSDPPVEVIIFDSVRFLLKKKKKVSKPKLFKKKTETGSNRPVSVQFGFLEQKLVQTGLAKFFGLARFFSGLAWFFFCLGLVRFFRFQTYKTEPNRSVFSKF